MNKIFGDLETQGVVVYVEDGKVFIADAQLCIDIPDTKENREKFIQDAKDAIKIWESEKWKGIEE